MELRSGVMRCEADGGACSASESQGNATVDVRGKSEELCWGVSVRGGKGGGRSTLNPLHLRITCPYLSSAHMFI